MSCNQKKPLSRLLHIVWGFPLTTTHLGALHQTFPSTFEGFRRPGSIQCANDQFEPGERKVQERDAHPTKQPSNNSKHKYKASMGQRCGGHSCFPSQIDKQLYIGDDFEAE